MSPRKTAVCILLWAFALYVLFALTGCKQEQEPAPQPEQPAVEQGIPGWALAEFPRQHGVAYDPLSRVSRAKMDVILGKPSPTPTPTPQKPTPTPAPQDEPVRLRISNVATALMGLKETGGKNRSPQIDKMNQLTGVPLGSPWCASFNAWVYDQASVPKPWPKSAWSPDWGKNPTWTPKGGVEPKMGDSGTIYYSHLGRIGHTFLVRESKGNTLITWEGNTSPSGAIGEADRNGDGSYVKRRLKTQVHNVRNWIDK